MALDLIIKNPHIGEEHAEFKVKAQRSMTVRELKATLRDTYPTRPEASAQTLIHGGRVVRDEKKLDDVISKHHDEGPKMFHLIVKGMQHSAASKRPPPEGSALRRQHTAPPTVSVPLPEAAAPPAEAAASPPAASGAVGGSPELPQEPAAVSAAAMADAQRAAADAQAQYIMACQAAMAQQAQAQQAQAAYAAQYYQAAYAGLSPEAAAQLQASLQYPTSPGLSPQQQPSPQGYPSSPQGYPASPQAYPASPQQVYPTPYNSPWGYTPPLSPDGTAPPAFSLEDPSATTSAPDYIAAHTAAVAQARVSAALGAAAAAQQAEAPVLAAARQRQPHTFTEEEEPLRGDQAAAAAAEACC